MMSMKYRLAPLALTALILCSSALPAFARAEEATPAPAVGEAASGKDVSPVVGQTNDVATPGNATPSTQPATDTANKPVPIKASTAADDDVYGPIMTRIMSLFAWLLGAATLMLDYAVYYGVVVMGGFVNSLSAVGVAWRILRDVGNILLIFGFLISGIAVIINLNIYGFGSKMLPMLLVAAVFVNFSLFITEAIVDVGNLFATEIFQQINGGAIPGPVQFNRSSPVVNEGISNRIMSVLGLQSLYRFDATTGTTLQNNQTIFKSGAIYIGFLGIILFLVAAFVMFSLAFVIIARFVALLFLIVVAPVGFAGLAIPQLAGLASSWWKQLAEQTITAPVLLLLLYIALAVITDANFLIGLGVNGGNSNAAANNAANAWKSFLDSGVTGLSSFAGIFFSFLVAMGLLLVVVVASKRMSAFGAGWATRMGGRIVGGAIGYGMIGSASLAGRTVFGGAGRLANTKYVQARAAQGGYRSLGWKALAFTGRNLEGRTYDLRNSRLAQRAGRAVAGVVPDLPGVKEGFTGFAAGLGGGTTITAKSATETVRQAWKKISPRRGWEGSWWRDQQKEYEKAAAELARKNAANDPTLPNFVKTLKRMSDDELTELRGIRQGLAAFVGVLSPEKYRNLQKSDKLLTTEKENLKRTWEGQFASAAGARAALGRFSTEEIAGLEGETLVLPHVVEELGQNEFEAIRRKGSLKSAERRTMYAIMLGAASAPIRTAFGNEMLAYFDPANDVGGNRARYWNV